MKIRIALVAGMVGSLFATSAFADEGVSASTGVEKKFKLGAQLELIPVGNIAIKAGPIDGNTDTSTAYGVGMNFDYDLTPNISVGAAPRIIFGIASDKEKGDVDTTEEIDLRARVVAHFPVADKLQVYGFAAPGFAISTNASADKDLTNPTGFLIAFGGGATYDVSPSMFLSAEAGYQLSFQSVTEGNSTGDWNTKFLSVGFGAGTRF